MMKSRLNFALYQFINTFGKDIENRSAEHIFIKFSFG